MPSNIGEWLQAMRELHRSQTKATERLAVAAERIADAIEGCIENGKAETLEGENSALKVVAEATGTRRRN